ncbi:TIGR02117 family protein [Sphingomonas sp. ASV193]|uniref:TIGR02117 family protein n=1 Tax=Sphingomonas sp. ASV193 TaxID=3144405 RepID=UPI0032E89414
MVRKASTRRAPRRSPPRAGTRRRGRRGRRIALALAAIPALYLLPAIVAALLPANRSWAETPGGVTLFVADNGIHTDLVLPVRAAGIDWTRAFDPADAPRAPPAPAYVAIGMGEKEVYLDTPRWRDIRLSTIWHALAGGDRTMHVEWLAAPWAASRTLTVSPDEYRRLAAAIRADIARDRAGRPILIDHPGYFGDDRFYAGLGRASALVTCNQWTASRLRLAGIRAPRWAPFPFGVTRQFRPSPAAT